MNLRLLSLFCHTSALTSASEWLCDSVEDRLRMSQIHTARPPIAATILVGESASEYTLLGTGIVREEEAEFMGLMWRVESHEAEMTVSAKGSRRQL